MNYLLHSLGFFWVLVIAVFVLYSPPFGELSPPHPPFYSPSLSFSLFLLLWLLIFKIIAILDSSANKKKSKLIVLSIIGDVVNNSRKVLSKKDILF